MGLVNGWVVAHNFDGCRYDFIKSKCRKDGYIVPDTKDTVDMIAKEGRILAVRVDGGNTKEFRDAVGYKFNREADKALVSLCSIGPFILTGKDHGGYRSFLFFAANEGEEMPTFEGVDADVITEGEAIEMARNIEPDEDLVREALDYSYIAVYEKAVDRIRAAVEEEIGKIVWERLSSEERLKRIDQRSVVSLENAECLLFDLVEKPVIPEHCPPRKAALDGARMNAIAKASPKHRAEEKETLDTIANAWEGASGNLANTWSELYPEETPETISAEDIISTMCLEHAKEAIEAGVPVADVIC